MTTLQEAAQRALTDDQINALISKSEVHEYHPGAILEFAREVIAAALANEPQAEQPGASLMINGLTEAETSASASVFGLVGQPGAVGLSEQAVMHALDMARTDAHKQGDRALFLAFGRRIWAQFEAQALAAAQPVAAISEELRAELAGHEAASGHLSALVDDLRGLLAEAMRVMKALHESATPDDGPGMDAIIPAGAFRRFVDDNANLMHLIHVSPHDLPVAAGWLPIETAPKDGAKFLAWHHGEVAQCSVLVRDDGECWRYGRSSWFANIFPERVPSHWQPLPPPPAATQGAKT